MNHRRAIPPLALLLAGALARPAPADVVVLGDYRVTVGEQGELRVLRDGRELLETPPAPFLEELRFQTYGLSAFGTYRFPIRSRTRLDYDRFLGYSRQADSLHLEYGSGEEAAARAVLVLREGGDGRLRVELRRLDAAGRGVRITFVKRAGARFLGFGEQYARVDHTGRLVPIWVSEQGIGRHADVEPGAGLPRDDVVASAPGWVRDRPAAMAPWTGRSTDTYYPVPMWIDPARGVGFLLEADQRSLFDLGAGRPDRWTLEVWEPERLAFELAPGPSPLEVVEQLSAAQGRPRRPPPWAFGTWLAVEGGEARVREAVERALAAGCELSAVWSQDWVGRRNRPVLQNLRYHWEVDRETYPGIEALIQELHARGLRFLGYINPFTDPFFPSHRQAARAGHLVGRPRWPHRAFLMLHSTFMVSLVDFTEDRARGWFEGLMHRMLDLGMDGWMADYGEWLPWAARLGGGSGAELHNRYPALYHRSVARVLDERRPDGDYVMLTRSGYAGAQRHQQVVWAGDQECTWDADDGLATVPRAGLSAGLAGIPFWTHDVGGYSGGPRTRELFLRWAELGAFTPVLRTHEGLMPGRNWQWDSDEETTAAFARLTRVHGVVARRVVLPLVEQAARTGRPLLRHLALHFPEDPVASRLEDTYMLGPDLLVAPVLEEGASRRRVYLPPGSWHRIWDGVVQEGPGWVEVPAPLGEPPAFSTVEPTRLLGEDWAEFMHPER